LMRCCFSMANDSGRGAVAAGRDEVSLLAPRAGGSPLDNVGGYGPAARHHPQPKSVALKTGSVKAAANPTAGGPRARSVRSRRPVQSPQRQAG